MNLWWEFRIHKSKETIKKKKNLAIYKKGKVFFFFSLMSEYIKSKMPQKTAEYTLQTNL